MPSSRFDEKEDKSENDDTVVALLDVDYTLIGKMNFFTEPTTSKESFESDCGINKALLASLKKNKIKNIYLFTDMTATPADIYFRFKLVKYLESEGFTVKAVVTPPDVFFNRLTPEQLQSIESAFQKSSKEELNKHQKKLAQELLKKDDETFTPGVMFDTAIKDYLGEQYSLYNDMSFSDLLTSEFDDSVTHNRFIGKSTEIQEKLKKQKEDIDMFKGIADNAIEGQHSKGLMFKELVKKDKIKKAFYADDHIGAVKSVETQAKEMPDVSLSICYIPRLDKVKDFESKRKAGKTIPPETKALHDAYYDIQEAHYDLAAHCAHISEPKKPIMIDKKFDNDVNDAYKQILKMTKIYQTKIQKTDPKNYLAREKLKILKNLMGTLENENMPKLIRLATFHRQLVDRNTSILNQHRTGPWKRYVSNALSFLTVLPFLARMAHSYYTFGSVAFWKPESEKLKIAALNEFAKIDIKKSPPPR